MTNYMKALAPIAGALIFVACSGPASSQPAASDASGEYTNDKTHAYISFDYLHQGLSRPVLRWRNWDATLDWNAEEPTASSVAVTIDATSIDSGVDVFDGHLRGENFFDVENHPEITFVSTGLEKLTDETGKMTGDLTIKGITKSVVLDVKLYQSTFSERANAYKIGFAASGTVKRSDFDVGLYVPAVSDDVNLDIQVEFVKPVE